MGATIVLERALKAAEVPLGTSTLGERAGGGGEAARLLPGRGLALAWHGCGFTGNGEAALKGKVLVSTVKDLTFVSRVILGGKLDLTRDLKVKTTRRPLKGIRKVARGRADATLVDAMAHGHLGELKLPVKLKVIHTSPGLPGLTLAVLQVNKGKEGKTIAKITAALSKLCAGEGKRLCKSFQIKTFNRAKAKIYRKLERQYHGK